MTNSLPLFFAISSAIASFQLILAAGIVVAFFICIIWMLSESQKSGDAIFKATNQADAQLREEIIEAQKIAFSRLAKADDRLKIRIAETLTEAAMHLGYPYLGGRIVYPRNYILLWKNEGLIAVAQARQLLNDCAPK
jgi:hypothetical protein